MPSAGPASLLAGPAVDVTRAASATPAGLVAAAAATIAVAATALVVGRLLRGRTAAGFARWAVVAAAAGGVEVAALMVDAGPAAVVGDRRALVVLARLALLMVAWLLAPLRSRTAAGGLAAGLLATVAIAGLAAPGALQLSLVAVQTALLGVVGWVAAAAAPKRLPAAPVAAGALVAVGGVAVARAATTAGGGLPAVMSSPASWAALGVAAVVALAVASPPPRLLHRHASIVVAAVAMAALLTVTVLPARSEPWSATLAASGGSLVVTLAPAAPGPNEFHLYVFDDTGDSVDVARADVVLQPPGGAAPQPVPVWRVSPNHYLAYGIDLAVSGPWQLNLATRTDRTTMTASATFEVSS